MLNKKNVLNIILGIAIVIGIISVFTMFIEYINIIDLKGKRITDLIHFSGTVYNQLFNFISYAFWISLLGIILVVLKLFINNKIFNYIANVVLCLISVFLIILSVYSFAKMWTSGQYYDYMDAGKYTFIKEMQSNLTVLAASFVTIFISFLVHDVFESKKEDKEILEKNI